MGSPSTVDDDWLRDLYQREGLSTYQIAQRVGLDRQQVTRRLRAAGVVLASRGAGRRRGHRLPEPGTLRPMLQEWYLVQRLTSRQIGDRLGMSERTVRNRLAEYGIDTRSRGAHNREDRHDLSEEDLIELYVRAGLTATEVGDKFGVSRNVVLRVAHDLGLPVRLGGPPPRSGPSEIQLIDALYADPLVSCTLTQHDVPRMPPGGTIWQRFPTPIPLTAELVTAFYLHCGLSANHIEMLTGQPVATVRRRLRTYDVPSRSAGGRTPFRRRWRQHTPTAPQED
jgi:DNA-binding CsgD family transcriptional regulator